MQISKKHQCLDLYAMRVHNIIIWIYDSSSSMISTLNINNSPLSALNIICAKIVIKDVTLNAF